MRVLITGGSGFVGRYLTGVCVELGHEVLAVSREPGEAPPGVAAESVDLVDRKATRRTVAGFAPDRVFHLAAQSSVARSWEDPTTTIEVNVLGSASLLEAVADGAPAARVLLAGSGDEYGQVAESELPFLEHHELRPRSPYAFSKASADLLGGFYADARGLDVVRTRAFNHIGPGQSPEFAVSAFARQIASAEAEHAEELELLTGDITVSRDFTDVRDVVRAYWLALERAPAGAYNVCSGRSVQLSDIVAKLAGLVDLEVRVATDPDRLRQVDLRDSFGSHRRLAEATGWSPDISMTQTLTDTLNWWRTELRSDSFGGGG